MNDRNACTPDAKAPLEWEGIDRMPFPPADGTVAMIRKFTRDSAGNLLRTDVIALRKEDLPVLMEVVKLLAPPVEVSRGTMTRDEIEKLRKEFEWMHEGKPRTVLSLPLDHRLRALGMLVNAGSITVNELRTAVNLDPHPDPEKEASFVAPDDGVDDLIERAWGIIANAHGGDWSKASVDWQNAAKKWRDQYYERRSAEAKEFAVEKDRKALAGMRDAEFMHPEPTAFLLQPGMKMEQIDVEFDRPPETCVGSAACARCLNVVCQCDKDTAKHLIEAVRSTPPGGWVNDLSWLDDVRGESFGLTAEQKLRFQQDKDAAARAHQAAFGTPGPKLVADPEPEALAAVKSKINVWSLTFHAGKNNDHARWWVQTVQERLKLPKPETLAPTNWMDESVGAVSWPPATQWLMSAMGVGDDRARRKIDLSLYLCEMARLEPRLQRDTGVLENELEWVLRVDSTVRTMYEAWKSATEKTNAFWKGIIPTNVDPMGIVAADPKPGEVRQFLESVQQTTTDNSRKVPPPPTGGIVYPKETSPSVTYWVGEGATVPANDAAEKVGVAVKIPNEQVRFAEPSNEPQPERKVNFREFL